MGRENRLPAVGKCFARLTNRLTHAVEYRPTSPVFPNQIHVTRKPVLQSDISPFLKRHIGISESDEAAMLQTIGIATRQQLIEETVPQAIRRNQPLNLAGGVSEEVALEEIGQLAARNKLALNFIGQGYYGCHTPQVIRRQILENPGWYTAYTPYQAEISQGRLQMLLNYQQMICDLTGLPVANASLLDEGTAAAEAMAMAKRAQRKNRSNRFYVDSNTHPQTLAVIKTRARYFGYELVVADASRPPEDCFAAFYQYPGTDGEIRDLAAAIEAARAADCLVIVACDLLALTLLKSPGELGADIAIGTSQRFGVPMGFGGPHAAFFAFRDEFKRSAPGRIIGVSVDSRGRPALRMAMQTREQHIRREKATSNICTSQVLLAVMAAAYAIYHGPDGLLGIAQATHSKAVRLAESARKSGIEPVHHHFFDTVCFARADFPDDLEKRAAEAEINLRFSGANLLLSFDETHSEQDYQRLIDLLGLEYSSKASAEPLPANYLRKDDWLTHEVFHQFRSETEMMRYLQSLQNKDLALDQSMIPLGSCTMKLNAAAEMTPVTWPAFANLHPLAPQDQTRGYLELIGQLEQMLAACTGYDSVSLQPNAGSQGEYAGLLAIARYHQSRGEAHRNICLIPQSAHGTNPASAQMAGMEVVVVRCDDQGNVDVQDLAQKAASHSEHLAAAMLTYPSTHGVFEEAIREICATVHRHGGQVYVDGANLNALVGLADPGEFGSDVSHLNLHKTFCIPHGGGGPGVGPIGVRAHLAPFLPGDPQSDGDQDVVSSARYGSASILPISWMYIRMMGAEGLKQASEYAILGANYIAARLQDAYPVLYRGAKGRVAHECIIDIRTIKARTGISEEDIAKRLMDYGFHAPTMSFPVAGTLMIEPTESESLRELDRFCDAMLKIRQEIAKVESGEWDEHENPLRRAPHTLADILEDWQRPYSREQAVSPQQIAGRNKYWPSVNRIDNVQGDRNLICSCPPLAAYLDQ